MIKRILSLLLCAGIILSVTPVVMGSSDPNGYMDICTDSNMVLDYTFNSDFYKSDIADLAIVDLLDESVDGFKTSYSDEGLKITRTQNPTDTGSFLYKFAFNFVTEEDSSDNSTVYKAGFAGTYAVEMTLKPEFSVTGKRTDFYFVNDIATENSVLKGPDGSGKNDMRLYSNTSKNMYWYDADHDPKTTYFEAFTSGSEYTIRVVIDTKAGKVYLYTLNADGDYVYNGENIYTGSTLTSLTWAPNTYIGKGDSVTFKSIKVYEIDKLTDYSGNVAYEEFKTSLPEEIVLDAENITDNIEIPDSLTEAGNVETLNEDVLKADGTVTRRFEDTKTAIKVSDNKDGIHFEKRYNLVVKAMDGIDKKTLALYDFSDSKISDEFVRNTNGQVTNDGYRIVNTNEAGEILGLLKAEKSSDTYSNTYYYEHNGAFDYELSLTPYITDGAAVFEVGNYNEKTSKFTPFGTVKVFSDKVVYSDTEDGVVAVSEKTSGNIYDIKFRTYTDENSLWIYVNSDVLADLPYTYSAVENTLNSYRVTFENGTENDSIVINNAQLTNLLATENTALENCLEVADSIKISDIVANPDAAYGNLNLPEAEGYTIEWSSNNPLVDLENKYIYRTTDDVDVVISALISGESKNGTKVLKEFKLKIPGTTDPELLLEGALAKIIPEKITNQNINGLIADISLPSVTEEGYAIVWDSLNDNVITDSGKIKNTNISKDTYVELKATVTSPNGNASKNIGFTVRKRGADVDCALSDITEVAKGVVTYTADITNTDGSMYLHDGDNKIIGFSVSDSKLIFDNGAEYQLNGESFKLKAVINSADQKLCIFADDILVLDYVKYEEKASGFKGVTNNGLLLSNEKVIFDEYSLFDYNVDVFDYFANLGEGYINGDVVLKTASVGGVNVEWTSSDKNVLSDSGAYTSRDAISFFDVTAKLTVPGKTDAYYKKTIECVAVPNESENLFDGAISSTNIRQDINNGKEKAFDNNFSTYFVGTRVNEESYITIDMEGTNDINSIYFFRDADDSNIKSCDIYVSKNGTEWNEPVASVNFSDLKSNYITFDLQTVRYIKIANIVTDDNTMKLFEIKGYVSYSSDDKAYKDIEALDMPSESEDLTLSKITLPTVGSLYGSSLVWKSSEESVISANGIITRPSGKQVKKVVLTVTATLDGKKSVKSFKYLVPGTGSGSGGAGGAGGGGGISAGVNAGGTTIAALPEKTDIVQVPSTENLNTEFNDVKISDWYYSHLVSLKNKGIIDGYDDGNFYPDKKITREEFIKILVVSAGFELSETSEGFDDVGKDDWFAPYVYTAKELNIVNGIDATNFGIGNQISRQDMAVMIYNVVSMKKDVPVSDDKFTDNSSIADYALNAVYSMKALEILDGYEDGTFNPKGQLTRAEAVKVISLIMNIL